MKKDIIKTIREKEREFCSRELPLQYLGRLEEEYAYMDSSELAEDIQMISMLREVADMDGYEIDECYSGAGSIYKYNMGATDVDPLPTHYICRECGKMEFVQFVGDGFDLPEKYCCGKRMKRSGHSIPFEHYRFAYEDQSSELVFRTSEAFAPRVAKLITEYHKLQKRYRVYPVRTEAKERMLELAMLPFDERPELDKEGFLAMTGSDLYHVRNCRHIYICFSENKERIAQFRAITGRFPETEDLLEKRVLEAALNDMMRRLSDEGRVPLFEKGLTFTSLLEIHGYERSNYAEDNPVLLDRNSAYSDLFLWREQVWDVIMEKLSPGLQIGTGLANRIMSMTRKGRIAAEIAAHRSPLNILLILHELGVDEHWITQMKYTFYLPCKADLINTLLDNLKIAWYELQH